jgi:hypothetical protein
MAPVGKFGDVTDASEKLSKRSKIKNEDDRGLKFGTDVAYSDVYGGAGDDDSEFVTSLPTEDEELKIFGDEIVRDREQMEDLDEGRISNHPSTLAASIASGKVSSIVVWSRQKIALSKPESVSHARDLILHCERLTLMKTTTPSRMPKEGPVSSTHGLKIEKAIIRNENTIERYEKTVFRSKKP